MKELTRAKKLEVAQYYLLGYSYRRLWTHNLAHTRWHRTLIFVNF
jgi:hypothetical protein